MIAGGGLAPRLERFYTGWHTAGIEKGGSAVAIARTDFGSTRLIHCATQGRWWMLWLLPRAALRLPKAIFDRSFRDRTLAGQQTLVGEDAVEGGAGDGELPCGAEFVASIEVEHVLNVMADDRVQSEIFRLWRAVGFKMEAHPRSNSLPNTCPIVRSNSVSDTGSCTRSKVRSRLTCGMCAEVRM